MSIIRIEQPITEEQDFMYIRIEAGQFAAEEKAEARIRRIIAKRIEEGKPIDQDFLKGCSWTKLSGSDWA